MLHSVPTELGWRRTNWTRELLSLELADRGHPRVAACTMGRALSEIGARLGMPKPTVLCPWDSAPRKRVLAKLRHLAKYATEAEPVFYEDEMDVHLNPKIGRDWMLKSERRYVVTPGQNKKRFVAGALNAKTKRLTWVDNYIIHSSKKTRRFLAQFGDRVQLHFLPPYCPDDNRIERVWLDLHANVTRNHRCKTIGELMIQVVAFMRAYNQKKKHNPSLKPAIAVSESRSAV